MKTIEFLNEAAAIRFVEEHVSFLRQKAQEDVNNLKEKLNAIDTELMEFSICEDMQDRLHNIMKFVACCNAAFDLLGVSDD